MDFHSRLSVTALHIKVKDAVPNDTQGFLKV